MVYEDLPSLIETGIVPLTTLADVLKLSTLLPCHLRGRVADQGLL